MMTVYTDGALSPVKAGSFGGWAWYVNDGTYDSGNAIDTTSNRMELQAVIEALEALSDDAERAGGIQVVTDSLYVVNCFADGWYKNWERDGWMKVAYGTLKATPVKNRDLWELLLAVYDEYKAAGIPVTFIHVRGHGKDPLANPVHVIGNDHADRLAVEAKLRLRTNSQFTA